MTEGDARFLLKTIEDSKFLLEKCENILKDYLIDFCDYKEKKNLFKCCVCGKYSEKRSYNQKFCSELCKKIYNEKKRKEK